MSAQEFELGGKKFTSKTELKSYISSLLRDTQEGAELSDTDHLIMLDLILMHPDYEGKIGRGVRSFIVRNNRENGGYPSKGFYIQRTDGTSTDFSYLRCLESNPIRSKFIRACREAIRPIIRRQVDNFFSVAQQPTCPLTGIALTRANSHVDHEPPCTFERIVEAFAVLYSIDLNDPSLCVSGDNILRPMFTDPVMRDRFVQFHNDFARLRVISRDANVSLVPEAVKQGLAR